MSDKKITELPVASTVNLTDVSILVSSGSDYQYAFSTLLQLIGANLAVGANISFGTTLPQNSTGHNGDVFINTSTGAFAQKISDTWNIVYTIPSTGNATDGTVLYGLGVPGPAIGNNNDTYINTGTGIFYKKSAGTWAQVFSMQTGPAGAEGTAGVNGVNGTNGFSVLNGTAIPSNLATGVDGDFYINTTNYTLFGPKTAGNWGTGLSLIGGMGPAGANGNTGATGPAGPSGAAGVAGPGVATGGAAGQALTKNSNTNFDTGWTTLPTVASAADLDVNTDNTRYVTALRLNNSKYQDQNNTKNYIYTTSGNSDYTANVLIHPIIAYTAGFHLWIQFSNGNTGAVTLNLNGLGAKGVIKPNEIALTAGDIADNQTLLLFYNGLVFIVMAGLATSGGGAAGGTSKISYNFYQSVL